MNRPKSLRLLGFAAPLLLAAAALPAQSVPVDIELGYRWVDVTGNQQMYRTQVNDRQGFLVRSLLYDSGGPLGGLDFFRLDASDLGAGPAGMLKLSGGRTDMFRLDFSFRHQDLYSSLPAFANPFLDAGIVPGQHTYNRGRDIFDANLQLLPGAIVSPILGYTRNAYHGPGRTTYTLGGDDFALDQVIRATDQEYRIGVAFHTGPVEGAVTQGWRRYRENDSETLVPGAGSGNLPGTLLGQPVTATGISRSTSSSVDTPVTSAWVSGRFLDRIKLTGSYVHASPDVTGSSLETDAGSFVSFQILRFFSGLTDTITPKVDGNAWRGQARAEIEVMPGVDVIGGWRETSSSLTGMDLVSSLYQGTVTFAGQNTGDILKLLQIDNGIDRTERVFDASVLARRGPLAVNAGWSQLHQDVTLNEDAAEIVITGGQSGRFERTVNTYGGGATFTMQGLTLTGDYRHDGANQPIFRSDFIDRNRWKARAAYAYGEIGRIGTTYQETHAVNNAVDIGYDTRVREIAGDLTVTAVPKILSLHMSAGYFQADRRILERAPQSFTDSSAVQVELGRTWEGGATITFSRFSLDGGYTALTNRGNLPFSLSRVRVRGEVSMTANLALAAEWYKDRYKESDGAGLAGSLSNYDGNRYYVGLHWKP